MEIISNFYLKIKGCLFGKKVETSENSSPDLFLKNIDYLTANIDSGVVMISNFISQNSQKTDSEPPKKQIYLSKQRCANGDNLKIDMKFEEFEEKPLKKALIKSYFLENIDKNPKKSEDKSEKRKISSKKKPKENLQKIIYSQSKIPAKDPCDLVKFLEKTTQFEIPSEIPMKIPNISQNPIQIPQNPLQKPIQNAQNPPINPIQNTQNPSLNPIQNAQNPLLNPIQNAQNPLLNPIQNAQNPLLNPIQNAQNPLANPIQNPQNPLANPIQNTAQNTSIQPKIPIIEPANPLSNFDSILTENTKKLPEILLYFQQIESRISPNEKHEIEGTIRRGIGQMYGSSMLRLFETADVFVQTYAQFSHSEEKVIFLARQFVKMMLENQVDFFFSQNEDKSTMRDRLARISILFHFVNLEIPCLIEFAIAIISESLPLVIPKNSGIKQEKNTKIYHQKIEYYSYLYFCIIGLDLKEFFSNENLREMERKLIRKNEKSGEFPEILDNFKKTQEKMEEFLQRKKIPNYNEFYWKFVEIFFKMPITKENTIISISFCYASYFIWKKDGDKIVKIVGKLKEIYLLKLKDFHGKMRDKNEKEDFRLCYNRLEEVVEDVVENRAFQSFEEKKEEEF